MVDDITLTSPRSGQRFRFGRRERRGTFLGLSRMQLGVIGGVVGVGVILLILKAYLILAVLALPMLLTLVLGAGRWQREPLLTRMITIAGFGTRTATGQTVAIGGPDAIGRTDRVGKLNLAGGLGSIEVHEVDAGGAFTYDTARKAFSFTLSCSASAWDLVDGPDQDGAVNGFSRFLAGLSRVQGLAGIDIRCRVDSSTSTDLEEYLEKQISEREQRAFPDVPCPRCGVVGTTRFCTSCGTPLRPSTDATDLAWVDAQARIATAELAATAKEFSYYITVTLTAGGVVANRQLAQRVRRGGGGIRGISQLVALEAASMMRALGTSGIGNITWLNAAQLTELIQHSYDPVTAGEQTRNRRRRTVSAEAVRPMAQEEKWDHLHVDRTLHQTFWISEWPTSDVPYGFLTPLITDSGDVTRVVTLQITPIPKVKALRNVEQGATDLEAAKMTRDRLGQLETRQQQAEEEDLRQREEDLADGHADMEFRGFVTISAETREQLEEGRNNIEVAAQEAQLELRPMYLEQAAAFNTAVLPVGNTRSSR